MKIKKGMLIVLRLLVILLVSTALILPVSAIDDVNSKELNNLIETNYISVDTARDHANFCLIEFFSAGILDEEDKWLGTIINSDPQVIYDINGKKLFYLFSVEKNGEKIGEIKIAASKIIGNSVITIGLQEKTLNIKKLEMKAKEKTIQLSGEDNSVSTQLVCYSYPKIGMMVSFIDPKSGVEKRIVIDSYDYSLVDEKDCFSYYGEIKSNIIKENLDSWTLYANLVKDYYKNMSALRNSLFQPLSEQLRENFDEQLIKKSSNEYKKLSNFPICPQEDDYWCGVASAQMISEYHGVTRTQSFIAAKMGTSIGHGTNTKQELSYYQSSIASGGLGKSGSLDYDLLYWYNVKEEIDNNNPFAVETPGHARACSGYWRSDSSDLTYLYINDPGNGGSQKWEWMNEFNPDFYDTNIRVKN